VLRRFYDEYAGEVSANAAVPFPTGIHVSLESHPHFGIVGSLGSHHQKFIVTEKGLYVGGFNLSKADWDTPQHLVEDPRRDTSNTSGSGGVMPRHDTGAIVRGQVIGEALKTFAFRWDDALEENGAFAPLIEELPAGSGDLEDYLESPGFLASLRLVPELPRLTADIDASADPSQLVDAAGIAVTLPTGTAWAEVTDVTDILDRYSRAIASLSERNSFLYIENQYFDNVEIARRILDRWIQNVSAPGPDGQPTGWPEQPFAFIVVTYRPDPEYGTTALSGILPSWGELAFYEMQVLKWLEVRTARIVRRRNAQQDWKFACAIEFPQRDVTFTDGEQDDPTKMEDDSEFRVENAVVVDEDTGAWQYVPDPTNPGRLIPQRHSGPLVFSVEDTMTDSDVMTYVLASNTRYGSTPVGPMGPTPRERVRHHLLEHEIYNHSKCTLFLNPGGGGHAATIGSANLNRRSLDDDGDQDSEMNVWWRASDHIEQFRKQLWAHHLEFSDPDLADYTAWKDQAWSDYLALREGRTPRGHVIRLDVVDRSDHLD
jgi:phosphatidylserine/phosphatidylglycerophosphate/cardiolipin synthase-like enzyme